MKSSEHKIDETRVAEAIVGVLPAESVVRVCSDDRDAVRFVVRDEKLRLRSIVLNRSSLARLEEDPDGVAKLDYLRRDLLACAIVRREFIYPRPSHRTSACTVELPVYRAAAR